MLEDGSPDGVCCGLEAVCRCGIGLYRILDGNGEPPVQAGGAVNLHAHRLGRNQTGHGYWQQYVPYLRHSLQI